MAEFLIHVATGDKKNAGTDANVSIILHDDNDNKSQEIVLDNFFRNDFERGRLDVMSVPSAKLGSVKKVKKIEFWRDTCGFSSDWYVDKIIVENKQAGEKFVFPILRWVKAGHRYLIQHLDTSLPQLDPHRTQRQMELEDKQKLYQFEQKNPGPLQIKQIPADELFSFDYEMDIQISKAKFSLTGLIKKLFTSSWKKVSDIGNLYTQENFPVPTGGDGWKDDLYFGRQRLSGTNNILIKLCTAIPEKLAVTSQMLEPMLEGNQLDGLLRDKRIFICDLEILEGIKGEKTLCTPIALFMVDNNSELRPLAIQLFQKPGETNPVFLPTDDTNTWILAKMWYNNADAAYHQTLTHLGFTHLIMEGVAVSAHRQLAQSHPVFKLLAPHFLYLIAINGKALQKLVSPGGYIDNVMSTGANGLFQLIEKGVNTWRLDVDGNLPEDLKNRGVDDMSILPNYHYRDDGLLLHEALHNYVTKYIALYYDTPEKVTGDWELQNWGKELTESKDKGGLGMKGIPNDGAFCCKEDVVNVLIPIIFDCSVIHAAANFLQYDQYGNPANYPCLMRGNPPTTKAAVDEMDLIKYLPDKSTTLRLMLVTKILSARGTNSLGNYEVQYVFDPKATELVQEFREELKEISKTISERNKTRKHPYDILDPQLIPNAISI